MKDGELSLYIGPMFSGKSTQLIRDLGTYADLGVECVYINSVKDQRDSTNNDRGVSSHSSTYDKLSPKVTAIQVDKLEEVPDLTKYKVVGVDESQFFPDLTRVVDWVDKQGKVVEVAGLDGTYERAPMGAVLDLVPYADYVVKLNAHCRRCINNNILRHAPFTRRRNDNKETVVVGGSETYEPLCRQCYLNGV